MAWTYDLTTDLGKVRLMIGDTQTKDQQLADAEINYFIGLTSNLYSAAADAIEQGILPLYSRDVDRSNIGMSSSRSQRMQHYMDLAKTLRSKAATEGIGGYAGGLSAAETESDAADTDLLQPMFRRGDGDNNGGY